MIARRERLHRALDRVLDRRAARDGDSVAKLEAMLETAKRRERDALDRVKAAAWRRKNKGQRLQSGAEMAARSRANELSSKVYELERRLREVKEAV